MQELATELAPLHDAIEKCDIDLATSPREESEYAQNREKVHVDLVLTAVQGFHTTWQRTLSEVNSRMKLCFTKPYTCQFVLRTVFNSIIETNEQLRSLVMCLWADPPCRSKLMCEEVLRHDVATKYLPTF